MKEIVIFAIGPVQSYIAAARRTQDLWAGSRLLSDIMAHALDGAPRDAIIFPQRDEDGRWPESLPNRAVAVIAAGQGAAVAGAMADKARDRWQTVAAAVRDWFHLKVVSANGPWDWREIWERQVRNWLEVYWIACPWDEAAGSYGDAYRRAGELLDARKLTRHFPDHHEYDVKSTLDGAYQALRGKGGGETYAARSFWYEAARNAPRGDVRRGERLSAIDLVKRFAQDAGQLRDDKTRFPSTSSIASADYRLALMEAWDTTDKPGTANAVEAFVDKLETLVAVFPDERDQRRLRFAEESEEPIGKLREKATDKAAVARLARYDGDYFYPDFYTEARFIDQLGRDPGAKLSNAELDAIRDARAALRQLYEATDRLDIPRPALYYAVIALDGDRMGRRLSHSAVTEAHHRAVSGAMARFARDDVPRIADQEFPAQWVYAGGDDALVLSPISCALAVAEALRRQFVYTVGIALKQIDAEDNPSASAGIAIVHQQNPLQAGIRRARAAEEEAKEKPHDRDALVVHRLTRGSTPQQVGGKWDLGARRPLVALIDDLRRCIVAGQLSGKFAYELREEGAALTGVGRAGQAAELERLLKRHTPRKEDRPATKDLAGELSSLSAALGSDGIRQVAEWAVLARFLATGGRRE